jgi:tetratricopeptide (TPR) repeat protein
MADLSLREYNAKLENLLHTGNATEVILHARHILQYYPRNVQTYRALGRALIETRRYPEAGEVLRRVLSVYPDDVDAHRGLSEVYLNDKRADDAIWHLERAFEQNPNDKTTLDNLRELYRRYRKVEQGKIQLTTGAVARQYLRSGLYAQAIEALQEVLSKNQQRPDLRLLLAQTYLDSGQLIEAGETATEVLQDLPDCLRANAILAVLWLSQERPSDAQPHINRIESLDPYLALELAEGQAVADEVFKLPELDYRREAEREMTVQSPEWIDNVGAGSALPTVEAYPEEAESPDWLADAAVPDLPPVEASDTGKKSLSGLLRRATGQLEEQPAEPEPAPDLFADLPSEPIEEPEQPIVEAAPPPVTTAEFFADLPDVEPDLMPVSTDEDFIPAEAGSDTDTDPLAWLRDSGVEVVDAPPVQSDADIFDTEADQIAFQNAEQSNPLAWMQHYGDDMLVEDAPGSEAPPEQVTNEADPLAWLKEAHVQPDEPLTEEEVVSVVDSSDGNTLDWLQDESLLEEAFKLEALVDDQTQTSMAAMPERQEDMADELDWMSEPDDDEMALPTSEDFPDWLSEAAPEELADEGMNWSSDLPNTKMLSETPSSSEAATPDEATEEQLPQTTSRLLGRLSTGELPSPLPATSFEPSVDESGFEWLSQGEEETATDAGATDLPDWLSAASAEGEMAEAIGDSLEPDASAADVPDWLSAAAPVENELAGAIDDSSEWLSEAEVPAPDEAPSTGLLERYKTGELPPMTTPLMETESDTPEWLKEMQPPDEEDTPVTFDSPDWIDDVPAEEQPVTDGAPESSLEPEAQLESAGFDWIDSATPDLEAIGDTPGLPDTGSEPVGEGEFEWLSQGATEEAAMPDWLAQPFSEAEMTEPQGLQEMPEQGDVIEPDIPFEAEAPMSDAEIRAALQQGDDIPRDQMEAWMSRQLEIGAARTDDFPELEDEAPATPAEPSEIPVAADTSGLEALFDSQPATDVDEPDWMPRSTEQPAESSTWLTQMQPEDDFEAQPTSEAEFSWSTDEQPVEDLGAEEPDWLTEMQAASSEQVLPDVLEDIQPDEPEWLGEIQPNMEIEQSPETAGDGFDWNVDNDVISRVTNDLPDWVTGGQSEEATAPELETVEDEMLTEIVPDDYAMPVATEPIDEYPREWVGSDMPEEQSAAPSNAPDWLNAMVPGLDIDYAAPEDEPIESEYIPGSENRASLIFQAATPSSRQTSEFSWLMDIVEQESQQIASVDEPQRRSRFVFSREPIWLRKPTEKRDTLPGETDDIDLPPWLR